MIPAFLVLCRLQTPDFSTPEATVRSFLRAVGERDMKGMAACVIGGQSDNPATGPKQDLEVASLFAAPEGEGGVKVAIEYTSTWHRGGEDAFKTSVADVLHLRLVDGRWLLVPPDEWKDGSVHYGGRFLASQVSEVAYDRNQPPREATRKAPRAKEREYRRSVDDLAAGGQRLVAYAQRHGGKLPPDRATLERLGISDRIEAVEASTHRLSSPLRLNPRLYGKPYARIKAGVPILFALRFVEDQGQTGIPTFVRYGAGKSWTTELHLLSREQLTRGALGVPAAFAPSENPPVSPTDVTRKPAGG